EPAQRQPLLRERAFQRAPQRVLAVGVLHQRRSRRQPLGAPLYLDGPVAGLSLHRQHQPELRCDEPARRGLPQLRRHTAPDPRRVPFGPALPDQAARAVLTSVGIFLPIDATFARALPVRARAFLSMPSEETA